MYTKFSVKDGKVSWNKEKGKKKSLPLLGMILILRDIR